MSAENESGLDRSSTPYGLDATRCFAFSQIDDLDFTLIGIGERLSGAKQLEGFGYVPLSDAGDKHMLGELANIVRHPEGRLKQIVLRDNNLVARIASTSCGDSLTSRPASSGGFRSSGSSHHPNGGQCS